MRHGARAPLRQRLFLLVVAGILPLVILSGIGSERLFHEQRKQAAIVGQEFAQALATAVDAELQSSVAVLTAVATAVALDRDDLGGFHARLQRVIVGQPGWAALTLADPTGKVLVDSRVPPGQVPGALVDPASFDRVVRTRHPVVGNLDRVAGSFVFPVRVPVVRGGTLRYVLTAMVKPDGIRDVVARQRLPGDWIISVFDGNGRRVARSRAHEENLGGEAAVGLQEMLRSPADRGVGQTVDLEGNRIYTSYSRLPGSGWVAAPGIPAALVEGAAYRSLGTHSLGVLLSIAVGVAGALWVARSINRPIRQLRAAAQALGDGGPLSLPDTSIEEIREVADALAAAAAERRQAEVSREQLLVQERRARTAADSANRAKDEFLAVVSHELRTPLNSVYGWARMLLAGQVTGDAARRALETIVRNADTQVQLIDDLLDVSRIITGKLRLDVRPVDLPAVVDEALDAIRPDAATKAIRLQSVLDPRAGPVVGDPARLQQVVWNLLTNAVKFTPRGGRVQLHLQRVSSHVEVVVSDTGPGIPAAVLPLVFERFTQADSSTTRTHGGLGLGLALVKHLVELHGGTVTAHSGGEGWGATFTVSLPISLADVHPASDDRAHPTAAGRAALSDGSRLDGVRVLLVDDDPDALAMSALVFSHAGALVRTSASAGEALEEFRRWRPDVLVSDIEMPGEDGYSLIRRIRALRDDEGARTPAVALTAYGRAQDRSHALEAGYNMHVRKPVDPGELTTIVASVTGRVRPMAPTLAPPAPPTK